ncbi:MULTISPECIES: ECF transporter S component [Terrisporobacter]|uniref:Membrane protein n=2 Tax=Terrisporobacter TaxID=1505652 RepID=A0A0B3VVS9_9FIRM|nr:MULTISPECIES: ECF transporter S component [Terrisporobacter]KHS56948.1 membrane protein [Terrisporobacter othiniensis]MCC3670699.1 ECF transporter S component [Terrisporobacter mayombei]MCR1822961.1 ECF transporter S component [Terrisporobacter muris]MDU6985875.1 ECF transporter S component [Terrisporobacter othiniensis]MDY3374665.1 ECF transporter S component [Terrisporobacter othiniensis]
MINTRTSAQRRLNVRKMTVIGVLSAISIMMSMLPFIGYIPIGPIKATIMHIPVIIGAIIEGPVVGAIIGLIFGLTSLWNAITQPVVLSPLFYNPLVSVLPRILIGIVAYYVYQGVYKVSKKVYASGFIAGIIGSLANTAGVLGMIYILYADKYLALIEQQGSSAAKLLLGVVLTSGVPEALVAGLIVSAVSVALIRKGKK